MLFTSKSYIYLFFGTIATLYKYLKPISNMVHECISCDRPVRPRQEGLLCDRCERWQHRTCGTDVSRADYLTAVRTNTPIDWQCQGCRYADNVHVDVNDGGFHVDEVPRLADDVEQPEVDVAQPEGDVEQPDVSLYANDLGDYVPPPNLDESDMMNPAPIAVAHATDDGPVTYTVVTASTERGKDILVDSVG